MAIHFFFASKRSEEIDSGSGLLHKIYDHRLWNLLLDSQGRRTTSQYPVIHEPAVCCSSVLFNIHVCRSDQNYTEQVARLMSSQRKSTALIITGVNA